MVADALITSSCVYAVGVRIASMLTLAFININFAAGCHPAIDASTCVAVKRAIVELVQLNIAERRVAFIGKPSKNTISRGICLVVTAAIWTIGAGTSILTRLINGAEVIWQAHNVVRCIV
jgi:hypothetical protein